MIHEGLVLSVAGGFCRVDLGGTCYLCQIRGRLKRTGIMPGDKVMVRPCSSEDGVVEDVLERRNILRRPAIANVDQALVVFTATQPPLHLHLVDRITVMATHCGLRVVLCLNKIDITDNAEIARIRSIYEATGFDFFETSALSGEGICGIPAVLRDRVSVMAGQSGVGKSRLLNWLDPSLTLSTGSVSRRTSRGRHTTHQVQLLRVAGGFVADAPGFARLDLEGISPDDLRLLYPEIAALSQECRFAGCRHMDEPDCAVRDGVGRKVPSDRYASYRSMLRELLEMERRRYD